MKRARIKALTVSAGKVDELSYSLTCIILVRNRAKEIVELLNDTDKIRSERKKARQNRNKYQGVGSDSIGGMGMMSGGGIGGGSSRYGGFGSDGLSSGSLGFSSITGIGGGSGGGSGYYDEDERPNRFESSKYDDFDDEPSNVSSSPSRSSPAASKQESKAPAKKEANLFDFDDAPSGSKAAQDDDWGDFASGAPAAASGSTGNGTYTCMHSSITILLITCTSVGRL